MSVNIEKLNKLYRKVTITFFKDDCKADRLLHLNKLSKNVKIPGFRPGKIPYEKLEIQYGMQIDHEVQSKYAYSCFEKILKEEKINIVSQPIIERKSDYTSDTIVYDVIFEIFPEIKIENWSSAEITKYIVRIEEKDIDQVIQILRKQHALYVSKDQKQNSTKELIASKGDKVTISYINSYINRAHRSNKTENFSFIIGEKHVPMDLENAVLGLKIGENKKTTLFFPKNHFNKKIAGKKLDFLITMKKIEYPVLPEVNDDFAKSIGVTSGLKSLYKEIENSILREIDLRIQILLKSQTMSLLLGLCEFDVPNQLIEEEKKYLISQMNRTSNFNDEEKNNFIITQAIRNVKLRLILREFIKKYEIKTTPSEIQKEIEKQAASYEKPKEKIKWYYKNPKRLLDIEFSILENHVVAHIMNTAKIIERSISFEELNKM